MHLSFKFWIAIFLSATLLSVGQISAQVKVVKKDGGGYEWQRNGQPYFVKGVGGEVEMDYAVSIGANSLRTWGIDNADEVLDEAHKKGLTVMLGFWLQHERHGFDYDNKEKVERQYRHFKNMVDKYKDHPALLCWGIGNELDLQYTNPACWDAVQQIAKYCHEVDPNHPTTTVTAGLDSMELQEIIKRVPDLDVYCINTYGDIKNASEKVKTYGWKGPYMITEWGPNGYWEVAKTDWEVSIEQTSTEKKQVYLNRYQNYIDGHPDCIGSYAFLWGSKQEYTETWFGLFSKDNKPTEPIDALEFLFTGENPAKPAPTIKSMSLDGKAKDENVYLESDTYYGAEVESYISYAVTDFVEDNNNELSYSWKILYESTDKKSGGDKEEAADQVNTKIKNKKSNRIQFRAPAQKGAYRLFVTIELGDKQAYANIPFYVKEPADGQQKRFVKWKTATMEDFE